MNRQAKRMMQRQKATPQDRVEAARQRRAAVGAGGPPERRKRTPLRVFMKEVRGELKKVIWPTRKELLGYTVVVLVAVVFLTSLVFGLDLGFSKSLLRIITGSGG
jgi:preprotein translocase subunit SecE